MSSNDKAEVVVEKASENNDKVSAGDAKAEKGAKRAAEDKGIEAKKARTDGEENGEEDDVEDEEEVEGEEEEEEEDLPEEEEDDEGEGDGEEEEEDA